MKKYFLVVSFFLYAFSLQAQYAALYPTHWFTGMHWNKVQIILRGQDADFSKGKPSIQYPGVQLVGVHHFVNGKYLALDIKIDPNAKPGSVQIEIKNAGITHIVEWPLHARREGRGTRFAKGVSSADFVYLLMPDRFSNGDLLNDHFSDLRDTSCDRKELLLHHGGDLKGVANHLDYLQELGITTLWMTPVNENDMPLEKESSGMVSGYHGYWFTDQYKIDKRYGGDLAYKKLIESAHDRGMKIIQDAVYNHVGIEHWMYRDAPSPDWINQWPSYTGSNHKEETVFDVNGTQKDKKQMLDGWFVPHLPDVNQRNPFVANYLIQYAIWATEEYGIDGWRVDTYKYCDEAFENRINDALLREYPNITVFGEAWASSVTGSAYFTRNNMNLPFKHNLLGVTDFQVSFAIADALNQNYGWSSGVNRLHATLAQDILYKNPLNNCIFLDNHDMDRFYSVVGEDMDKYKQGIGLLLTLRGIPQLYYGTEILMKNNKNPSDAMVRFDFPGGFSGDPENKFLSSGRTRLENEAFNFVKNLADFRKKSSALQKGKTMQYLPSEGLYVYFRYDSGQTVMCVLNTSDKEKEIRLTDYAERTNGFKSGKDVISGTIISGNFTLAPKKISIIELSK